jgi:hypothetical protein
MLIPAIALSAWFPWISIPPGVEPVQDTQVETGHLEAQEAAAEEQAAAAAAVDEPAPERLRLKVVTPEIVRLAQSLLDLPMGFEHYATVDGHTYVFVLELHYHPPGFVGGPNGYHKGVTVYEQVP